MQQAITMTNVYCRIHGSASLIKLNRILIVSIAKFSLNQ